MASEINLGRVQGASIFSGSVTSLVESVVTASLLNDTDLTPLIGDLLLVATTSVEEIPVGTLLKITGINGTIVTCDSTIIGSLKGDQGEKGDKGDPGESVDVQTVINALEETTVSSPLTNLAVNELTINCATATSITTTDLVVTNTISGTITKSQGLVQVATSTYTDNTLTATNSVFAESNTYEYPLSNGSYTLYSTVLRAGLYTVYYGGVYQGIISLNKKTNGSMTFTRYWNTTGSDFKRGYFYFYINTSSRQSTMSIYDENGSLVTSGTMYTVVLCRILDYGYNISS